MECITMARHQLLDQYPKKHEHRHGYKYNPTPTCLGNILKQSREGSKYVLECPQYAK